MLVYTIGHSTREISEFTAILKAHAIDLLADVRTVPRSRHNPQFNRESLPDALALLGIAYRHLPGLGGLRRARPDSPNTGWRNASFRGFADYMLTPEFAAALDDLMVLAAAQTVAIMCAEAVPWRCHRSLIGDALLVRGVEVADILGLARSRQHKPTPFAHVEDTQIIYQEPTDMAD